MIEMREYQDIMAFCHNNFIGRNGCATCPYSQQCNCMDPQNIQQCYSCLKKIHSFGNALQTYSCEQMCYNYVLKHLNRYASEVLYALWDIKSLSQQPKNVCSIGCGPATELYALRAVLQKLQCQDDFLHYKGFDINPIWDSIWTETKNIYAGLDVNFYQQDAFQYYKNTNEKVDVLILNYVMSFVQKNRSQELCFMNELLSLIDKNRPLTLIVNDVLSININIFMCDFQQILQTRFVDAKTSSWYFRQGNVLHNMTNKRIQYNLLFQPSLYEESYNPFSYCNSAQLIAFIS